MLGKPRPPCAPRGGPSGRRRPARAVGLVAAWALVALGCRGVGRSDDGGRAGTIDDPGSLEVPGEGSGAVDQPPATQNPGGTGADGDGGSKAPSQPSGPTTPTQPADPTQPTQPTTPTQPNQPTNPTQPTTPPVETHFIGRFADDPQGGRVFGWPGSAIQAEFIGTGIRINLEERIGPTMINWPSQGDTYEVFVDGTGPALLELTGGVIQPRSYVLARDLPAGTHTIRIVKRTEMRVGTARFLGWKVDGDGQINPSSRAVTRRLLVIGDSISTGYGVLGDGASCRYSPRTQSSSRSWGMVAGAAVGADVQDIAWSGKGVFRNYGDPPGGHGDNTNSSGDTMMTLWQQAVAPDRGDFVAYRLDTWVPQVVVINLGTNDFSGSVDARDGFTDRMTALVQDVLGAYPDAFVALVLGPMLWDDPNGSPARQWAGASLGRVVDQILDAKPAANVQVLDVGALADGDYGCDSHPNIPRQQAMAASLVDYLTKVVGWSRAP